MVPFSACPHSTTTIVLCRRHLRSYNGVLTSATAVRRFHPLEWAAALGWPCILRLPTNLQDAWHQLGNTLSPQQALFGLCSALSNSHYTYDFHSVLTVMQHDAIDLTNTFFSVSEARFNAESGTSFLRHFVPPTFPFIHSIQTDLYHAPRNLLLRSTSSQQVVTYLQHETYFAFLQRHHIQSAAVTSPMNGTIFPSATMLQLHLQHRFLNTTQRVSSDHNTSLPPTFLTFQSRNLSGSFYLIDDFFFF